VGIVGYGTNRAVFKCENKTARDKRQEAIQITGLSKHRISLYLNKHKLNH
jgi:hypothetical protein